MSSRYLVVIVVIHSWFRGFVSSCELFKDAPLQERRKQYVFSVEEGQRSGWNEGKGHNYTFSLFSLSLKNI